MSVKFTDNSELVKEQIKKGVIAGLLAATGEVRSQTIRNSKRITSKTANSFQIAVDEDKLEGYVGSDYENAIWEEFGTGEYALNGDGRKGGWFYEDAEGKGHFTHGKKAKRPMFRAYTSLKQIIIKIIQEHISEALK